MTEFVSNPWAPSPRPLNPKVAPLIDINKPDAHITLPMSHIKELNQAQKLNDKALKRIQPTGKNSLLDEAICLLYNLSKHVEGIEKPLVDAIASKVYYNDDYTNGIAAREAMNLVWDSLDNHSAQARMNIVYDTVFKM